MKSEKARTMFYRRVAWLIGQKGNLEGELKLAHAALKTTAERTFPHGEGEIQGLSCDPKPYGLCFHVASYVPHQPTSLVPFPSRALAKNTSPLPPPDEHNYLEGDIFFVLSGNHLVLCPSGARESVALQYISHMLRKFGREKLLTKFNIEPIANIDKVKLLANEGVKMVSLNASLYEATTEYTERKTTKMTLLNGLAEEFLSLFSNDKDERLHEAGELENLSVRVEISFDSRKRGGEVGRERLEKTASKLIADDEDQGFTIVTGNGKKLTADAIRINEKVVLPAHGNSVSRTEAWSALADFLEDLKQSGTLEQ